MFNWICPSCGSSLSFSSLSWRCPQGHNFDVAKSAYVNLLLAHHKGSKAPGDSKEMLLARRDFLNAGYYQNIVESIADAIKKLTGLNNIERPVNVLDCGCGEGYYLQQLQNNLPTHWFYAGIDISKTAIELASKRNLDRATWVCASNKRLPLADQSVDVALRVFAPPNNQELVRVLRPGGYLFVVTPAEDHLIEIKSKLYSEIKPYAVPLTPDGFIVVHQDTMKTRIHLDSNLALRQLLSMTPFLWNGDREAREQLLQHNEFSATIQMIVSCYQLNVSASVT